MCGKHLLKSDARVVKSSPSLILRTFNINFICWLILSLHLRVPLQAIIFFGITFLQAILAKDIQHFRNISAVHCFALSDHTRKSKWNHLDFSQLLNKLTYHWSGGEQFTRESKRSFETILWLLLTETFIVNVYIVKCKVKNKCINFSYSQI